MVGSRLGQGCRNVDDTKVQPVTNDRIELFETAIMDQDRRRCRHHHRFRPDISPSNDRGLILDRRQLLSGGLTAHVGRLEAAHEIAHPAAHHSPLHAKAQPKAKRVGPAQEINTQFANFLIAFRAVEQSYISTLNQQTTNTVTVSATVTQPYAAGSPVMVVDDATVFGPAGTFSPPVNATAEIGGIPVGTFVLLGSSGNQLVIDVPKSSSIPLNPSTVITANVPASAQNSAATIFPSYISSSTTQLAVTLLQYFNNLPIPLPRKYAAPHQNPQTGAIQEYVYQQIASGQSSSLKSVLMAITLPTTPGGDLRIYDAAVNSAVATSRLQVLDGVKQLFAGKSEIAPITSTTTSGTGTTSTGTSSTSASGTGSTTA
jgi:hypothetical protein